MSCLPSPRLLASALRLVGGLLVATALAVPAGWAQRAPSNAEALAQPARNLEARTAAAQAATDRLAALAAEAAKTTLQPLRRPAPRRLPDALRARLEPIPYAAAKTGQVATFVVTGAGDTPDAAPGDGACADAAGTCTLRAALEEAEATAARDSIAFAPSDTPLRIAVGSLLPTVTQPLVLDGTTPGCDTGPCVVLDGGRSVEIGLTVSGPNVTVRGLAVGGFTQVGGLVTGADAAGARVEGSYFGVEADGATALPNGTGLVVEEGAAGTLITGCVVSGNAFDGLLVLGAGTDATRIAQTFVGTDASGTGRLGNSAGGLVVGEGATSTRIEGSVVAASGLDGVFIVGAGTDGTQLEDNRIGVDVTGTLNLGNAGAGVLVAEGAANTTIGVRRSPTAVSNVIGGNGEAGIFVQNPGTDGTSIGGNHLGTDRDGTTALPNRFGVVVGFEAANTLIGGLDEGAGISQGNLISGNLGHGVFVVEDAPGTLLVTNSIGTDVTGLVAIPNLFSGVFVAQGPQEVRIGVPDGTDDAQVGSLRYGNLISGNAQAGVLLSGAGTSANQVESNRIGTDASGRLRLPNGEGGVAIVAGASGNVIGGTAPGTANVISGNDRDGVALGGRGTSGNAVVGNLIGTDPTGTLAVANAAFGVLVTGGASGNVVGGTPDAPNVVSGNAQDGVVLFAAATSGNEIADNVIGADITGTEPLGNRVGVFVDGGAASNTIARNVIAGNRNDGILVRNVRTAGTLIGGNGIGVDASGTVPLGNGFSGVFVDGAVPRTALRDNVIGGHPFDGIGLDGAVDTIIEGNAIGTDAAGTLNLGNRTAVFLLRDATGTRIGGMEDGVGNRIAFSRQAGVVLPTAGAGNAILGNRFYGQRFQGIDLLRDGPTPNDPGDPDDGPNRLQNTPVLTAVSEDGQALIIDYAVDSDPGAADYGTDGLLVEFYATDADGDEGQTLLGRARFTTMDHAAGRAQATLDGGAMLLGETDAIVATATDAAGNTSEFSAPAPRTADAPRLVATKAAELQGDDGDGQAEPGQTIRYIIRLRNASTAPAENVVFGDTVDPATVLDRSTIVVAPDTAGTLQPGLEDDRFEVALGTLAGGETVEIRFDVTVRADAETALRNQGTLNAEGLAQLVTDDPLTTTLADATVTPLAGDEGTTTEDAPAPDAFRLEAAYPHPASGQTALPLHVPAGGAHVRVAVYDVLGRVATRLVDGWLPAGPHTVRWDVQALPSGLYLVQAQAGAQVVVRRVLVVR